MHEAKMKYAQTLVVALLIASAPSFALAKSKHAHQATQNSAAQASAAGQPSTDSSTHQPGQCWFGESGAGIGGQVGYWAPCASGGSPNR
jgi:hypothetical protein